MADLIRLLVETGLVADIREARRVIAQGAVRVNGRSVEQHQPEVVAGDLVQVGRTRITVALPELS